MSLVSKLRLALTFGRGVIGGLSEAEAGDDPLALFRRWFHEAEAAGALQPEAMTLVTCAADATPSARMVLLKAFDERGFVFYTNYDSRKARELEANPKAALVLHWPALQRQVRIDGRAERTSEQESRDYFASRPRGSRLAAWASEQSAEVSGRGELERRYRDYEQRFAGGEVDLPPFWGGYRVAPASIEFFQGRANRLHDRLLYLRRDGGWERKRLFP